MSKNPQKINSSYTKEDAYRLLDITNGWISNIDTKASFLLAYISVMLGFIVSNGESSIFDSSIDLDIFVIIQRASLIVLYLSVVCCILVLFVTIKARIKKTKLTKESLLFFGSISSYTLSNFTDKTISRSDEIQLKDILEQVHVNSKICNKKAKLYNVAVVLAIVSTVMLLACFCFGTI